MGPSERKRNGSYFTPSSVVRTLVSWAVRSDSDTLIDPSCGDGRFIAKHRNSVGIERDGIAAAAAAAHAPFARVRTADFFEWAECTSQRFDCAVGNPPFIRYQSFKGEIRKRALALCAQHGARFSGLTSSWAPFLVAVAGLLKPSGRLAFVVPAEIGHAPYSSPLLEFLARHFAIVHVIAIKNKLFPKLSEDCWLLYASGFGSSTGHFRFSTIDSFEPSTSLPRRYISVSFGEWSDNWNSRLRPFLLSDRARDLYRKVVSSAKSQRFSQVATTRIGYVSGANDFFHLRPSQAHSLRIPNNLLYPTVRNGRILPDREVTTRTLKTWINSDLPVLLLRIPKTYDLPPSVCHYLNTEMGMRARKSYKCRTRKPWYSVPDVRIPDFFLTYLAGRRPSMVRNSASLTCTNTVHCIRVRSGADGKSLAQSWQHPFVELSCELEGHPLGGGLLKLEPREVGRIALPTPNAVPKGSSDVIREAVSTMRSWRHYLASM